MVDTPDHISYFIENSVIMKPYQRPGKCYRSHYTNCNFFVGFLDLKVMGSFLSSDDVHEYLIYGS